MISTAESKNSARPSARSCSRLKGQYSQAGREREAMHEWRRLGPCSDTTVPYWEVARGSEKEPSFQQVVDLGPHLGRIVIVGPIDLPPSAGLPLSLRGAPVEHGAMCRRQGGRYHPSGERTGD